MNRSNGSCAAQVIPEGILVFFPSYQLLGKTLAVWRKRGHAETDALYDRLTRKKPIVLEPREANGFDLALREHASNIESRRGSLFLAVCRGKSSEGLDFSDRLARAVVLVGIPYPMLKDPKVSCSSAWETGHATKHVFVSIDASNARPIGEPEEGLPRQKKGGIRPEVVHADGVPRGQPGHWARDKASPRLRRHSTV